MPKPPKPPPGMTAHEWVSSGKKDLFAETPTGVVLRRKGARCKGTPTVVFIPGVQIVRSAIGGEPLYDAKDQLLLKRLDEPDGQAELERRLAELERKLAHETIAHEGAEERLRVTVQITEALKALLLETLPFVERGDASWDLLSRCMAACGTKSRRPETDDDDD